MAFASQCYHWPVLIAPPVIEAQTAGPILERSASPELRSVKEELEEEPIPFTPSAEESGTDSDSADSTSTMIPTPPISPKLATHQSASPPVIHLPIHSLPIPSPETYSYIHNLLHFTHSPAPSTFSPLQNILGMDVADLHKLDSRELMKKLAVIQGVWKNCCYLGIGDVKIWMGMRDAWGAVVGIVAERNKKAGGDVSMDTQ